MSSNLQRVLNKISRSELPIGTAVSIADPAISEIYCNCGFDFIWIDTEHSPIDDKNLDLHINAIRKAGVAPFVRVPGADPLHLKKILDMGPAAIIFPQVKSLDDVKFAVSCCKYPPDGIRGFGPRRAIDYGMMEFDKYLELSKSEPWIILQIEHIDAVNNLEEILKIKGVDSIVVGPCDLSFSMGLPNMTGHADVLKAFDKIGTICNKAKIPLGISIGTSGIDNIKAWIKRGIKWIQGDADVSHLISGGLGTINIIKKAYSDVTGNKNKK